MFKFIEFTESYHIREFDDDIPGMHQLKDIISRQTKIVDLKTTKLRISENSKFIEAMEEKVKEYNEINERLTYMNNNLKNENSLMIVVSCKDEGIRGMYFKMRADQHVSDIYNVFRQRILPKISKREYQIL